MATLVAHTAQGSANTNGFTSGSIDTTGANLLIFILSNSDATGTLSDSKGNTYTLVANNGGFGLFSGISYCKNPAVGTGHTFTVTCTATSPALAIQAWSSMDTTSPLDVFNSAASNGTNALQTGSITPGSANEVLVTSLHNQETAATTFTINLGFTISDQMIQVNGGHHGVAAAYLIQTTATAENPTWSDPTGTNMYGAVIASFKSASAAVQVPYNPWMQRAPLLAQ